MPTTVMVPITASPGETTATASSVSSPAEPASAGSTPVSTPYPHKPAAVHRCGREFFRQLSRKHVDGHPSTPTEQRIRLKMQGRSLINVLLIMRKRLMTYQLHDSATMQDVNHCALLLDDLRLRWATSDGFASCLIPVDSQMQHVCSKLFQECTGTSSFFGGQRMTCRAQCCWSSSKCRPWTWPPT